VVECAADSLKLMLPSTLFIGLETYSLVGGLQNFNRRVLANLDALAADGDLGPVRAHLMGDRAEDLPSCQQLVLAGFGRDRARFILASLKQALRADYLLVGHVNLLPVAWMAKMLKPSLKAVMFVHGDEVWATHLRPKRPYEPFLLRAIDRVASVSQYTAGVMSRAYGVPPSRFVLFPNAVDTRPSPTRTAAPGRRLLCVTRMGDGDREKNVDQLIRAVGRLVDTGRPTTLTVIGDGSLRPELQALARDLGLGDYVSFLGRASNEVLEDSYAQADVFVLPSSKEGFGIVYLEAWQHDVPVICGALGAPHEIVSDGVDGFVADENSDVDLAAKIDSLLSDPERAREMGRRGRAKVEALYLNANAKANLAALLDVKAARA
jgi:phosphatidyl-myo-inositol dimannoside synthase